MRIGESVREERDSVTRSELIIHLTALAEEAERSGERDAALVLFALVLALGEGSVTELACFVARV